MRRPLAAPNAEYAMRWYGHLLELRSKSIVRRRWSRDTLGVASILNSSSCSLLLNVVSGASGKASNPKAIIRERPDANRVEEKYTGQRKCFGMTESATATIPLITPLA